MNKGPAKRLVSTITWSDLKLTSGRKRGQGLSSECEELLLADRLMGKRTSNRHPEAYLNSGR